MGTKKLNLNSVSRFSKKSPQLVLEVHDHCEVPAGCGGVVLRWWNPYKTVPCLILFYADCAKTELFLDGLPSSSGRPLISFGEHVLAFRLSGIISDGGLLLFAGTYQENEDFKSHLSRPTGLEFHIASSADGTWKYTVIPPVSEAWAQLDFDDSGWNSMISKPVREPDPVSMAAYWIREIQEHGAESLGTAGETVPQFWVRKKFSLQKPNEVE